MRQQLSTTSASSLRLLRVRVWLHAASFIRDTLKLRASLIITYKLSLFCLVVPYKGVPYNKGNYYSLQVLVGSKVSGCKNRYDCCDRKSKSKGCREVCKKCDKPWGTKANGCFEREHNIIIDAGESNRIASAAASAANIARGIGNRIDVLV